MKNIQFAAIGQSIYKTFTASNGRVFTELVCITATIEETNGVLEALRQSVVSDKLKEAAPDLLEALIEAKRCLVDRIRIQYSQIGADEETAERMANLDIQNFLLSSAINKATL